MLKKKPESLLGLPPILSSVPFATQARLTVSAESTALFAQETAIIEGLQAEKLLIEAGGAKTKFAIEVLNEVKCFAATDVWATVQHLESVRNEAQGTAGQAMMDEFSVYLMKLSARHTLGIIEVNGKNTADLISAPLMLPPPPAPPTRSLLDRLFGE